MIKSQSTLHDMLPTHVKLEKEEKMELLGKLQPVGAVLADSHIVTNDRERDGWAAGRAPSARQ